MVKKTFILYTRNFIFGSEDSLVSTVGLLAGVASAGVVSAPPATRGIDPACRASPESRDPAPVAPREDPAENSPSAGSYTVSRHARYTDCPRAADTGPRSGRLCHSSASPPTTR